MGVMNPGVALPLSSPARCGPVHSRLAYWSLLATVAVFVVTAMPAQPVLVWVTTLGFWIALSALLRISTVERSLGLYLVVTAALLTLNIANLPPRAQFYGLLATAICIAPFALIPVSQVDGFPFLHVFSLVQAVYLYVGFLLGRPDLANISQFTLDMRVQGLYWYLWFMVAVVTAGLLVTKKKPARGGGSVIDMVASAPRSPNVVNRAVLLFAFGFLVPKMFDAFGISDRLGTISDLLGSMRIAAYAVLVLLWLSKRLTPAQKILVIGMGTTDLLVGLSTGGVHNGAPLAFAVLTILVATERRSLGIALLIAIFFALSLNSAKTEYRYQTLRGEVHGHPLARGVHLVNLARKNVLLTSTETFSASASRFSYADLLGYVNEKVPSQYPYWDKRSYTFLPLALMPRIISPWKPKFTMSNEFGREFGLISPNDFNSSTNMPLAVEAYVNFGPFGMVGVGAAAGLILGLASRRWKRDTFSQLIVASVCATALVAGIESGVSTWIIVIPLALVLRPLTRWIFADRSGSTLALQPVTTVPALGVAR